jgi:hypothetical protein
MTIDTLTRLDGHPVLRVPDGRMERVHRRLERLGRLPMWVLYRPPTEYGPKWVARLHVTLPDAKPTRFVITHDSLWDVRELLPAGLVRMAPNPEDHPSIVEVWL